MRNTPISLVYGLFFLGTACACSHSPQSEEAPPVLVEIHDYNYSLDFSSFLNLHKIIGLSAPKQEAFVKDIERLLFADNRIFVMDRSGNKVVCSTEKATSSNPQPIWLAGGTANTSG